MEQARDWMGIKRKYSLTSPVLASTNPSYGDSWEEQAFAEDAAGALGGCIWPPRSYSCSFCRREFRSAQALGGHMNVHRRDRARLKQSPSPQNSEILIPRESHHNLFPNPCKSLDVQYPPQICNFVHNPNSDCDYGIFSSSASRSRVPAAQTNCNDKAFLTPFASAILQKQENKTYLLSPPLWSDLVADADRESHVSDLKSAKKNSKVMESNCKGKSDYVAANLSVSLNLVVCPTHPTIRAEEDEEEHRSCKRQRTDSNVSSFFPKPTILDKYRGQSDVFELRHSSIQELDLELRLGDRPKVK